MLYFVVTVVIVPIPGCREKRGGRECGRVGTWDRDRDTGLMIPRTSLVAAHHKSDCCRVTDVVHRQPLSALPEAVVSSCATLWVAADTVAGHSAGQLQTSSSSLLETPLS